MRLLRDLDQASGYRLSPTNRQALAQALAVDYVRTAEQAVQPVPARPSPGTSTGTGVSTAAQDEALGRSCVRWRAHAYFHTPER